MLALLASKNICNNLDFLFDFPPQVLYYIQMKIVIHRVSCRACVQIFCAETLEKAKKKHRQHIKNCQALKVLQKVERFRKRAEKILGRKMTFLEASKLLGG